MPLTFPSHAAAVWPLHRAAPRVLPAAALIVGSCTPDFAYLLDLPGIDGLFSHSLRGTLLFSVPIGFATLAWLDLVAPALGRRTASFPRTLDALWRSALALWLGALTHLLWDGFTHRTRWPASVLYPTTVLALPGGVSIHLANLLQHLSTVTGLVIALLWFRREPRAVAVGIAPTPLVAALLGVVAAVALRPDALWAPWLLFWTSAQGALVGFTVAALLPGTTGRAGPPSRCDKGNHRV